LFGRRLAVNVLVKRRKLSVRLTPETIPFREGEIRIGLVPFPRKRKDGTYKIGQDSTPYLVFPDNTAYAFNLLFEAHLPLPWTDGTPITLEERERLDDAGWGIMLKYGLIIGEFLTNAFSDSQQSNQDLVSSESNAGGYSAWIAHQIEAVPDTVIQALERLLARAMGQGDDAFVAAVFLVACEYSGSGFALTWLLRNDPLFVQDMTHVFEFVLNTGRAPQRDCVDLFDHLLQTAADFSGTETRFWAARVKVHTDAEAVIKSQFLTPVPMAFDTRPITKTLDLAVSKLFAHVDADRSEAPSIVQRFLFSWWLPDYFAGVNVRDLRALPAELRAAVNVVWLAIVQDDARPPLQYRARFEQLLAIIPDVLRPDGYRGGA
jgi:hypothetical protein